MEIDKKKVAEGLKTAANVGYDVAKTGVSIARDAAPVVGAIVKGGLGILSELLPKGNTGSANGGANQYVPSDNVVQLGNQMNSIKAPVQNPSQYQDYLQQTMDAILNKKDFKYDMNADALYQQYKDQYMLGGQMAMQDTMGQASALTGGYGNSYAQTVGQQQYQAYLQQLNDRIPELYQLARDSYDRDTANLYNKYGLLSDAEQKEYSRYRDEVADFYTNRDYYTERYYNERGFDYGQWDDNRKFAYIQERDAIADSQWQAELDQRKYEYNTSHNRNIFESDREHEYKLDRDAVEDKRYDEQWANTLKQQELSNSWKQQEIDLALKKASSSGGSGGSGSGSGGSSGSGNGDGDGKLVGDSKGWFDYDQKTHEDNTTENGGSHYADVLADLKSMKQQGKSNSEAYKYLLELVGNSLLSQNEYLSLYNKYRDNRLG